MRAALPGPRGLHLLRVSVLLAWVDFSAVFGFDLILSFWPRLRSLELLLSLLVSVVCAAAFGFDFALFFM
jgi:hypothetical protein